MNPFTCLGQPDTEKKTSGKGKGTNTYLDQIQAEAYEWVVRNFGEQNAQSQFIGVVEEVGELGHAILKSQQGIRTNEDHRAAKEDAVGDILIYLMNYCSIEGLSLRECLEKTWNEVKKRDWQKNKTTGVTVDSDDGSPAANMGGIG